MALIGGGGAGNVAGGNPSGTGTGLTYVGDHCYAYSGGIGSSVLSSIGTMLSFDTGSSYILGNLIVTGSTNTAGASPTGGIDSFYLKINGELVMAIKSETNTENSPTNYTVPILLPPQSSILVEGISNTGNDAWVLTASISGRVYG